MTWWIPLIFVLGFAVSVLGLVPSIAESRGQGSPTPGLFGFGVLAVLFGWAVAQWLVGPFPIRPRIVPYFTKELGPLGGPTVTAFRRGRELYRNLDALEGLAATLGVKPLSAFGFAYDHDGQDVRWHPAAEGLATIQALRRWLSGELGTAPDLAQDLDALASVLGVAAERGVDFSLVLRLFAKDSLQAVSTREIRQGSFW